MLLEDRVENLLCGFLLLDLWKMLADKECQRRRLPKGALFLHPETMRNLQQSALGVVGICLTKNPEGNFWSHSRSRLTELPVEQWFGRLRVQSVTAQLSARSYWQAGAREMLRAQMRRTKEEPTTEVLDPLPAGDFRRISEKAYKSALRLVAWSSETTTASLQECYEAWCERGGYRDGDLALDPADDEWCPGDDENAMEGESSNANETKSFLDQISAEAGMHQDLPEDFPEPEIEKVQLGQVPDQQNLADLLHGQGGDALQKDMGALPGTLHEALWSLPPSTNDVELLDSVWRLTMFLRYWKGGFDGQWIANPRYSRRNAGNLNWFQCLGWWFRLGISLVVGACWMRKFLMEFRL